MLIYQRVKYGKNVPFLPVFSEDPTISWDRSIRSVFELVRSEEKCNRSCTVMVILWMEEILHQLVNGFPIIIPLFPVFHRHLIVPNWCRISSIHSITSPLYHIVQCGSPSSYVCWWLKTLMNEIEYHRISTCSSQQLLEDWPWLTSI